MEDPAAREGLRFGARSHRHGLGRGVAALPADAVRVRHHEPGFILRIGFQVQNASREHVRRDDVEHTLVLIDSFALEAQERQPGLPLGLAPLAVRNLHLRIAVVVAFNQPFKAEVDQRGMVDDELAGRDFVPIVRSAGPVANAEQAQKQGTCIDR